MILLVASLALADTWELVRAARDDEAPVVATVERRVAVHALTAELARYAVHGSEPPNLDARAAAIDLLVHRQEDRVALHGAAGLGYGLMVVRLGAAADDLVLLAPHSWADVSTGPLVAQWFDEGFGRAAVFNTVHRYRGPDRPESSSDADVAHHPEAVFQAMVLGLADALVDPLVVEIHGFSERRGDFGAVLADGGALQPASTLGAVGEVLEPAIEGALGWGSNVWRLAATKNVQGHALSSRVRFVHMELSRDTRRAWRRDPVRRSAVGTGLVRIAGGR